MLPTPCTSHVPYARVYEPAEDSFLLLDTLSSAAETAFLASRFPAGAGAGGSSPTPTPTPSPLALEIGPGSGVVLAFVAAHAARLFSRPDVLTLGIDVNRFACAATVATVDKAVAAAAAAADADADATAEEQQQQADEKEGEREETGSSRRRRRMPGPGPAGAGFFLGAAQGDLAAAVRDNTVDVLIFNPPYVPTPELPSVLPPPSPAPAPPNGGEGGGGGKERTETSFEEDSRLLALSYAGGRDGMETTNRLIEALPRVLSRRGCAYLLLCAQNKPEEVKERIRGMEGGGRWRAETVGSSGKQAGWEKLQIVRIWRDLE